ncbi:MAG: hypothetical protein JW841_12385 [Deltaproteobacteria bacterium]|nr:hypothetical protein [Deltaproteobacteria bacterium]
MKKKTYRNIFAELGYSEADIEKKVNDTWQNLFEGPDHQRIYFNALDNSGYMVETGNNLKY